ncbi:sce7726 family protein [Arcticibacter tournemirensis]
MKKNLIDDYFRSIAAIFSVPIFKEIFKSGQSDYVAETIFYYRSRLGFRKEVTMKKVLGKAYKHLMHNYRNEYVYKNHIANNLLLERHNLNEAVMLNELRVGASIADIVIINGTNTVYEVKTELDSPYKLKKQISDYRKFSPKIYLVTHHSLVRKYEDILGDNSVGLLSLSSDSGLSLVKEAVEEFSLLDNKIMMSTLRKDEYSNLIMEAFGDVPKVANIKFYRACLALIEKLDPVIVHTLLLKQLRTRAFHEERMIQSKETPEEIKHICLTFNPNKTEFQNLYNFLNLTM